MTVHIHAFDEQDARRIAIDGGGALVDEDIESAQVIDVEIVEPIDESLVEDFTKEMTKDWEESDEEIR